MKADRTEDLIVALAADAAPVRALAPLPIRTGRWLAGTVAAMSAGAWVLGVRQDLSVVVRDGGFLSSEGFTLATGIAATSAAFTLSIPGAERTRLQRWFPIATGLVWAASLASRFAGGGGTWTALAAEPWHLVCGLRMLLLAAAPAAAAFVMIRRGMPLQPGWAAAQASLAALGLAAVGVGVVCPIDAPSHLLVAHALPLLVLTVAGAAAGVRVLAAGVRAG